MREAMHRAAARRDDRLARIRKLSLWITGGAAVASLGLGTAFAHAMPGHAATGSASTGNAATSQGTAGRAAGGTAGTGRPAAASAGTKPASHKAAGHTSASHKSAKLTKPASTPKPTQAPPVVQSGGS